MLKTRIIERTENAYECPLLIKRLLLSGVRYERNREIVYRDSIRYSYAELHKRIARLANVLTNAGVKAGDTVAVMDWDSHRYLECLFAIPMLGAVLHTINVRLSPEQILYTMNHAQDTFVLVNSDFAALYQTIASSLETVEGTLLLTDQPTTDIQLPNCVGEYEALLAQACDQYAFADFDENSVATTFYTTGTTGNPKGVYFTHRQLVLHTLSQASSMAGLDSIRLLGSNDVYMPITPMFHVHAWGMPYTATLLGVKQVYPGRYEPDLLVELWRKEQVTFSHCVPTILQMVLNAKSAQGVDFKGWKLIIGGSALTRSLYDEAYARGIQLTAAYGMSETCPMVASAYLNDEILAADPEVQISQRIKAGVPVPLVEAAVIDAQGNALPWDGQSQGELVFRAPWLTQGYFLEPEKSLELWTDGWLHTGDVATIDDMACIEIRDRIKDVIKTGGEWISSLELEDLISAHADVREVAVVGLPDEQWGERPFALIVPHADRVISAEKIRDHLSPFAAQGIINKWAIPKRIACVTEIPKTSVGKLDKKRIRIEAQQWVKEESILISEV